MTCELRCYCFVLAWLCCALCAAAQAGDEIDFDVVFDLRQVQYGEAPQPSPDGQYVAIVLAERPPEEATVGRYAGPGVPASAIGSRLYLAAADGSLRPVLARGNTWRPSWSPDGRLLAFYGDAEEGARLWLYDLEAGVARRASDAPIKAKLWPGDAPAWSPDGSTVFVPLLPQADESAPGPEPAAAPAAAPADGPRVRVFRSGSERAGEEGSAPPPDMMSQFMRRENEARLGAIDVASGAWRVIVDVSDELAPSVLRLSPSGEWLTFFTVFEYAGRTTATHDLWAVRASGGAPLLVAADLEVHEYAYHELNYRWHPSEDALVFVRGGELFRVDFSAAPGAPRPFGAGAGVVAPLPLLFTADGGALLAGVDPEDRHDYLGARPRALAAVDWRTEEATPVSLDGAAYAGLIGGDARRAWAPRPGEIGLLLQRAGGEIELRAVALATGAARLLLEGRFRLVPGGVAPAGLIALYEDIATPPNVVLLDGDGARRRLTTIEPRLEGVRAGRIATFETLVPAPGGGLRGVKSLVIEPQGERPAAGWPTIVLFYPGADETHVASCFGAGATTGVPNIVFTSRGFALLFAEVPLSPEGLPGNPLCEMTDGLVPQVVRAADLGYVDLRRAGVMGQSYGGYGTACVIARTNLFRAACATAGLFDLGSIHGLMDEEGFPSFRDWCETGQGRMGGPLWSDRQRYIDNSPYWQADRIHTPLLIVHGTADSAVEDARRMYSALERLGRSAQLAVYEGGDHVISEWRRPDAVDAARRITEFFERHLRAAE